MHGAKPARDLRLGPFRRRTRPRANKINTHVERPRTRNLHTITDETTGSSETGRRVCSGRFIAYTVQNGETFSLGNGVEKSLQTNKTAGTIGNETSRSKRKKRLPRLNVRHLNCPGTTRPVYHHVDLATVNRTNRTLDIETIFNTDTFLP